MNCQELMGKLSSYLEGELDPPLLKALEAHLQDCEDCGIIVDTTRKTIEFLCNSEPLPLPSGVRERLDRALAEKMKKA